MNPDRHAVVGAKNPLARRPVTDIPGNRSALEKLAPSGDIVDPGDQVDGFHPLLHPSKGSGRIHRPAEMTAKMPAEGVCQDVGLK